jgi:ABC-2 type transport system ATP-binding protein
VSKAVLEVEGLVQVLRGRRVLRGVGFAAGPGVWALLGPNGAGKSVLLRTLAGILPPMQGMVRLGGQAVTWDELARRVAYVPQFPGAHPRLSVRGHVERVALWSGVPRPRERAAHALERMGLGDVAEVPLGRLGVAVRRRTAVAAALVRDASVLLFDEPTADLDPAERAGFWAELASLRAAAGGSFAAVVTTHLLDEVALHCDGAVLLDRGRALFHGPVGALAAAAEGRTSRLAPGQPVPPEAVVVGVDEDGSRLILGPAGGAPRPPSPLDGYLVLVGAAEGSSPPRRGGRR